MNTGLIIIPPPRDALNFDLILKANTSLKAVERYYKTGRTMDQKETSQCVSYSSVALLNAEPIAQDFNPEKLYKKAKQLDGLPNVDGTSVFHGAKALEAFGLIDKYYIATEVEQVFEYILTISPVLMGCVWTEKLWNPKGDGQIKPGGAKIGGHCTLFHSIDTLSKRIYGQNSWGEGWGNRGHFWLSLRDFEKLFSKEGMAVAVREIRK